MAAPIQVSPDWITHHARLAAWLMTTGALLLISLAGYFSRQLFNAINSALADIKEIKDEQVVQSVNHLTHIEAHTLETRDAVKEMSGKIDVLISIMEKK